jgi:hypothetical protein
MTLNSFSDENSLSPLPDDILVHIKQILAILIIQNSYRRFMMRHCKAHEWTYIRFKIMRMTSCTSLQRLMDVKWIRNEWRSEPESWVHMLWTTPQDLHAIIAEDC